MKRSRIARPGSRVRRVENAASTDPSVWSRKEKACLRGVLVGLLALIVISPVVDMRMKYVAAIDRRLSKWQRKYELTETQVQEIRRIEMGFHKFQSVAFGIGKQSPEALEDHCREVASHMNPKAAELFIQEGEDLRE